MELKRRIWTNPPFDRRDPDPSKDYGIGGLKILWSISDGKRAVGVYMYFGIYPKSVKHVNTHEITVGSLDYHWDETLNNIYGYEDDFIGNHYGECNLMDSGKCFSDGGYMIAKESLDIYLEKGDDGIFEWLEEKFNGFFYNGK